MGTDQAVEIMRHLLREALIISAPVLIAASLTSFGLSLVQTLTSPAGADADHCASPAHRRQSHPCLPALVR